MTGNRPPELLLEQGEGETIEFKESFDDEAIESVAAFANTKGGSVFIGVADNGAVKGVQIGKETLRDWANRIAQSVHVNPRIGSCRLKEKTVVLIEVAESPSKPVPCRGRYFKRVDRSNRQMTEDDLTRSILDKVGTTWDERVEPRAAISDIDPAQIERFRTLCNKKGRRTIAANLDAAAVLGKLDLLHDGSPTRAAILLFGKEPQRFYSSASIKIGRFRSETLIVDDREVGNALIDQAEAVMGYFREHLQTRFERRGTPARDVIWEYPLDALREAVINAICHRDYSDVGQIQIRWHDERLTILNPGELPESLNPEKLKHEHSSKPRNRKIAEVFYYAGLIEKWGSGTLEIINSCRKAGLPEPLFEEKQGGLWLTFLKDTLTDSRLRSMGLGDHQVAAILHAKGRGRITNSEYQDICNVSKRTASRELVELEAKGLLKKVGKTGKGTYYELLIGRVHQRGHKGAKGAIRAP